MQESLKKTVPNFRLAGVSYAKTNTRTRGLFAVDDNIFTDLKKSVSNLEESEIFVLSTCNRTEIYGFADSPDELVDILCSRTEGTARDFMNHAYTLDGNEAITHFYRVACGLDSQILGDFDVSSQIKRFTRKAREAKMLGAFTERLINNALQASKRVKNETGISSGTVSVSFAVVRFLQQIPGIINKNILLIGTGKIGRNTCKNLRSYLGIRNMTLINRTLDRAKDFAEENELRYAPFGKLPEELEKADIILVATNASEPTLKKENISSGNKLIIDLSVPHNVDQKIKELPGVTVLDVDELSKIKDQTLEVRKKEIPQALSIIEEQKKDFMEWYEMRRHATILKAVKGRVEDVFEKVIREQYSGGEAVLLEQVSGAIIQKMINVFAGKLKDPKGHPEFYYRVLGELFKVPMEDFYGQDH